VASRVPVLTDISGAVITSSDRRMPKLSGADAKLLALAGVVRSIEALLSCPKRAVLTATQSAKMTAIVLPDPALASAPRRPGRRSRC